MPPARDARPAVSAAPTSGGLKSFLGESADTWSTITGSVDRDAFIMFGLIEAIARTWNRVHAEALAVYGLNLAEWTTIGMLRSSPPDFRRSPTDLRRLVGQTSAGMSRILRKLTDGHLVRRERSPSDGRGQDVILTPQGMALAEESFRRLHAVEQRLIAPFASEQRHQLVAILDELRLALSGVSDSDAH